MATTQTSTRPQGWYPRCVWWQQFKGHKLKIIIQEYDNSIRKNPYKRPEPQRSETLDNEADILAHSLWIFPGLTLALTVQLQRSRWGIERHMRLERLVQNSWHGFARVARLLKCHFWPLYFRIKNFGVLVPAALVRNSNICEVFVQYSLVEVDDDLCFQW